MPRTDTEAIAVGAATFEDVLTVRDFARDAVRPVIERFSTKDDLGVAAYGLFLRGLAWLGTLAELKHPQHFQAALAGTRTLLEICVDLALLHHDRQNCTPEKLLAWERSAKLKAAERTKQCYAGRPLPPQYQPRVEMIARESAAIQAERLRIWPNRPHTSHPVRWTDRSMEVDAATADGFGGYGFRDYYDGRFAELCWGTHGSGLILLRNLNEEQFPGLIAMAFDEGAKLGTLVCKLTLLYLDKFDAIMEVRFRAMEEERRKWNAVAYGQVKAKNYLAKEPGPATK